MKTILTLLFLACIMAGAMNAQNTMTGLPDHGVVLAGSPDSPFLINGSAKTIVAYVLRKTYDLGNGNERVGNDITRFNPTIAAAEGLPIGPGASDAVRADSAAAVRSRPDGTPLPIKKISVDLVLFSDGTMAGPDVLNIFSVLEQGMHMDKGTVLKVLLNPKRGKK